MKTTVVVYPGHAAYLRVTRDLSSPVTTAVNHPKLVPVLVALIIVVIVTWLVTVLFGWRRITWRDHMDTTVSLLPRQARHGEGSGQWKVVAGQREVPDPSLVLLRVRNSGFAAIRDADIRRPITLTFPGREVKEFTVTDCRRVSREMIQLPGESPGSIVDNRIYLPRFTMKRQASFKLLVLLSGTNRGVLGKGRIRRGSVVRESFHRGPMARNIAFGTVLTLLVGTQGGITFGQEPVLSSSRATGRLLLEGSTAFARVAQQTGQAYTSACPALPFR